MNSVARSVQAMPEVPAVDFRAAFDANLKLMTYLLQAAGHTILGAGDGMEALEIIARETPDLIVCDIARPDDRNIAPWGVADPSLFAVQSPCIAFAFGRRQQAASRS